ncbi:hypothetical protein [Mesorhizobium sp.]|uniref:hypothetical protein n=1 Tax=Mesorhizobium sp. TaxID=1871066 RepID=UPI001229D0E7|nr:hypothetical protein [Mesorhizobium sp.]TIL30821.1 MAG: hypothetical protein E5Y82_31305 [Mesorhizobium sp.]
MPEKLLAQAIEMEAEAFLADMKDLKLADRIALLERPAGFMARVGTPLSSNRLHPLYAIAQRGCGQPLSQD